MIEIITHNVIIGFHFWKQAGEETNFLRNRHRHCFDIRCWFIVNHEDRELEIYTEQQKIQDWLNMEFGTPCEFDGLSCEAIARKIQERFNARKVQVLEDGYGGASVTKEY